MSASESARAARSRRFCQAASVTNGMNGCSRRRQGSSTYASTGSGERAPCFRRTFAISLYQSADSLQLNSSPRGATAPHERQGGAAVPVDQLPRPPNVPHALGHLAPFRVADDPLHVNVAEGNVVHI